MEPTMDDISRVTRSKESARRSYDRMSRWYDAFAGSEKKFADLGLALLDVQSGEQALEIGYGTGYALVRLAEAVGESGKVHGIDLSEGMRRAAEARLAKAGLYQRADLRLGDAASLPYPDSSFDAIFLCFTLELFDTPEIPLVLGESRRVLRDGGRVCVVSLLKEDTRIVRLYEWFHQRMPETVDCRPIHPELALVAQGFTIQATRVKKMWGLPVQIVMGRKAG
jgi:demethylmenaquinone methyltransferase/2-methoxy-6-polyprenyl-1,4-benzoquinol methylase